MLLGEFSSLLLLFSMLFFSSIRSRRYSTVFSSHIPPTLVIFAPVLCCCGTCCPAAGGTGVRGGGGGAPNSDATESTTVALRTLTGTLTGAGATADTRRSVPPVMLRAACIGAKVWTCRRLQKDWKAAAITSLKIVSHLWPGGRTVLDGGGCYLGGGGGGR